MDIRVPYVDLARRMLDLFRYDAVCSDERFYDQPNPGFCSGTSPFTSCGCAQGKEIEISLVQLAKIQDQVGNAFIRGLILHNENFLSGGAGSVSAKANGSISRAFLLVYSLFSFPEVFRALRAQMAIESRKPSIRTYYAPV